MGQNILGLLILASAGAGKEKEKKKEDLGSTVHSRRRQKARRPRQRVGFPRPLLVLPLSEEINLREDDLGLARVGLTFCG